MTWLQRRRNRIDLAVLGAIIAEEGCFFPDIQRRIGMGSGKIYSALHRLEQAGLIDRDTIGSGDDEGRVLYDISFYWVHGPDGAWCRVHERRPPSDRG